MAITRLSPTKPEAAPVGGVLIVPALGLVAGLGWLYLVYMAWAMAHMEHPAAMLLMPAMTHWGTADLALVFVMWVIMMAAMMLPSAAPMVRMFAFSAQAQRDDRTGARTSAFVAGYMAVWTAFSAIATLAQWCLLELRLVSPMMESASHWLSGALLLGAGLYQFTPLKDACLSKCRSPLGFLMTEWRPGVRGAFLMGLRHGAYCTGCCAVLMLLLFVLGVMNLAWIALLTLIVLAEKYLWKESLWPSRALGTGLVVWGVSVIAGGPLLP
jgi:predicted metal-binding membrane protein